MKYIYSIIFISIAFVSFGQYAIDIKVKNYDNDTIIVGNYYADKQLVVDTLMGKKGKFSFAGKDTLAPGVYFVLLPTTKDFVQFFVNEMDTEFKLEWDTKIPGKTKFKGSKDNALFNEYLSFLDDIRPKADVFRARLTAADTTGVEDKEAQKGLDDIDKLVSEKQKEYISKLPGSMTGRFIKSSLQVDIPEYEGEDAQLKTYRFYKKHYFDNVPLADPASLRTPYLHKRIDYYLDKLTPKDPDSVMISIDYLLGEMEPAPETYKYYLSYFLNKYAKMKIVGYDAVYVYLVDNYYAKGKAPWVGDENLNKMIDQANQFRPILIGKQFPNIKTYKADSLKTPVILHEIESDYTVVLFWAHDCGHCTKSMPDVVKFYDEYQDKGVTLLSICTKGGKKMTPCQEAIPKKKMEKFINTFDEYQRYRRQVYIPSTPKIFILDKDKNILIKDIPAKELMNVMPQIMEIDQSNQLEKR